MLIFLLALAGFAFLDSLHVLNVGITAAVVVDSRLSRRSPVPAASSFIAGIFFATTAFGISTVLGLSFLTDMADFEVTPTVRYWVELVVGVILLVLGSIRLPTGSMNAMPAWVIEARRKPLLLGLVGAGTGLVQAPTAVPYLAALAMLSVREPRPMLWPLIVGAYCLLALLPPILVLFASTRRSTRAQRSYRTVVRALNRFGPTSVRILFLLFGAALLWDALRNHSLL
ncbi:Sap-like sulfolipid-1-addressing protein [Nocardia tenerifensis]|uniref:Sap-like sulfolipid-1-addressing protein n=1 Tax=Nocardia tenerifensis TaxID=228006 RepID=A0A318K8W7_9NOCA|nr:GAP family protein [Nocardia tenerifensis]PXX60863.1 Sap-like sulfolipid-1-addressing protein [Nocardia tenerifensis]